MKSILTSFTIGLFSLSIVIIVFNITGYDDRNILLVELNPILNILVHMEPFRTIIWQNRSNGIIYILSIITNIIYGLVIDLIIYLCSKVLKVKEKKDNIIK